MMGFEVSDSDSSVSIPKGSKGPIYILLYVDDLVITEADLPKIDHVKFQLLASFEMKDLGDLHYFLAIEVIHTPNGILLTQRHYVLNMLYKFGMTDCRSVTTPLDRNLKLCYDLRATCNKKRSRKIIRSLIYLTITRRDLSYLVGLISQFMQKPTTKHLQCAYRIHRYANGTKYRGLLYRHDITKQYVGYTDVDYAGNATDRCREEYASRYKNELKYCIQ